MMQSDYFNEAKNSLHSARKFAQHWGTESDRKYAAFHTHQALLFALKGRSVALGCMFDHTTSDVKYMLDIYLTRDKSFLLEWNSEDWKTIFKSINEWGDWSTTQSVYDNRPAPSKETLFAAISIAATMSVPFVNLMHPNVEPTDEQLSALMREVSKDVLARNMHAKNK